VLNRDVPIGLLVAAGFGAVIWAASPLVTSAAEPWDAESPYYFASLLIAGTIVGLLFPRNLWVVFVGIVLGQLAYLLVFLPSGPLLPLGVLFLLGYGLIPLLAAALASWLRRRSESDNSEGRHGT
jgi:antibiotic biosynthesis monooxygenase (ABM) superfamily enzyme